MKSISSKYGANGLPRRSACGRIQRESSGVGGSDGLWAEGTGGESGGWTRAEPEWALRRNGCVVVSVTPVEEARGDAQPRFGSEQECFSDVPGQHAVGALQYGRSSTPLRQSFIRS